MIDEVLARSGTRDLKSVAKKRTITICTCVRLATCGPHCRTTPVNCRRQVVEPYHRKINQDSNSGRRSAAALEAPVPTLILRSEIRNADGIHPCACGIGFGLGWGCSTSIVSGVPCPSGGVTIVFSNHGATIVNGCCTPVSPDKVCKVNCALYPRGSDRCAYSLCCGPLLADG